MKKTFFLGLIGFIFLTVGCSKSDDRTIDIIDEVSNAPYIPLENFGDLGASSTWYYSGAKIGNNNFGAISNSTCLSNNVLLFAGDGLMRKDSIVFDSFLNRNITEKDCLLDFRRTMRKVKMMSKGQMYVHIYDYTLKLRDTAKITTKIASQRDKLVLYDTIKKTYFEGNLEIGFQKDFLRVQDKFTRYTGDEKVYLYFKNAK